MRRRTLLLMPQTFMNLSGEAVREAMQFYKIPPERTVILFDDISLPVGTVRVRRKGSDGGQRGMKSIIYLTGSDQFPRIKIGVGSPTQADYDMADWVLGTPSMEDRKVLVDSFGRAADAAKAIVSGEDLRKVMGRFN